MQQVIICLVLLAVSSAHAAKPKPPIDKKTVRKAIAEFRKDPVSENLPQIADVIFRYAEESPDVEVNIKRNVISFLGHEEREDFDARAKLLLAFIAGNVDAQLTRRQTKDDPYAGVLQIIATYRQLQKRNPNLRVPAVEKFIELEKQGQLKATVNSQ